MPQPRKPRGICAQCGAPIPAQKPATQRFRDSACKNRWWQEQRMHEWLVVCPDKYQREYVGRAVPPFMRAWLYERQRQRTGRLVIVCEQCQASFPVDADGKPRGETINHRNGHPWDNRPDNLEILCGRCERHDPHNGARNRGRGRRHDRDAYRPADERAEIVRLLRLYQDERTAFAPSTQHRALLNVVYSIVREENPVVTIEQVGRALEALLPSQSEWDISNQTDDHAN